MQDAFAHCEALLRAADKDRFLTTLFAPAEHRDALVALYAFNAWRSSGGGSQRPVPVPTRSVSMLLAAAKTRSSE